MNNHTHNSMNQQTLFQQLTHPWRDRLYGVALRYTRDQQTAEDWVQETLLRAWRNFSQLSEHQATYAWLLKILDHVVADDSRRHKRRQQLAPVLTTDDKMLQTHHSSAPGPFEQTLNCQIHNQLAAAVMSLPDVFSTVIMLRDMEGLSYQEIAGILDIPRGTVMSRLSRGRRLLAKVMLRNAETDDTPMPITTFVDRTK